MALAKKANIIAKQLAEKRPLSAIYFEAINGHYRFVRPNAKDKTVGEERMSLGGRIISKQKGRLSLALKEPSQPYASLKNGQKSRFPKP